MFEAIIEKILNIFVTKYVQNFDKSQLNIRIWSGDIKLDNLSLKTGVLDDFNLPIKINKGLIESVRIQIPWATLSSHPVKISISGVYLLAGVSSSDLLKNSYHNNHNQNSNFNTDQSPIIQGSHSDFMNELQSLYLSEGDSKRSNSNPNTSLHNPENDFTSSSSNSFFGKFLQKIINNTQITVSSVHIRFEIDIPDVFSTDEYDNHCKIFRSKTYNNCKIKKSNDKYTIKQVVPRIHTIDLESSCDEKDDNYSNVIAIGITLDNFVAHTTDSDGNITFNADTDDIFYKVVFLSNLSLYVDCDVMPWSSIYLPHVLKNLQEIPRPNISLPEHCYILCPVSSTLKLMMCHSNKNLTLPKFDFDLHCEQLSFTLRHTQYKKLCRVCDVINKVINDWYPKPIKTNSSVKHKNNKKIGFLQQFPNDCIVFRIKIRLDEFYLRLCDLNSPDPLYCLALSHSNLNIIKKPRCGNYKITIDEIELIEFPQFPNEIGKHQKENYVRLIYATPEKHSTSLRKIIKLLDYNDNLYLKSHIKNESSKSVLILELKEYTPDHILNYSLDLTILPITFKLSLHILPTLTLFFSPPSSHKKDHCSNKNKNKNNKLFNLIFNTILSLTCTECIINISSITIDFDTLWNQKLTFDKSNTFSLNFPLLSIFQIRLCLKLTNINPHFSEPILKDDILQQFLLLLSCIDLVLGCKVFLSNVEYRWNHSNNELSRYNKSHELPLLTITLDKLAISSCEPEVNLPTTQSKQITQITRYNFTLVILLAVEFFDKLNEEFVQMFSSQTGKILISYSIVTSNIKNTLNYTNKLFIQLGSSENDLTTITPVIADRSKVNLYTIRYLFFDILLNYIYPTIKLLNENSNTIESVSNSIKNKKNVDEHVQKKIISLSSNQSNPLFFKSLQQNLTIEFLIPNIGVSLVDIIDREICLVYLQELHSTLQGIDLNEGPQHFNITIKKVQIDNQLPNPRYDVLFYSLDPRIDDFTNNSQLKTSLVSLRYSRRITHTKLTCIHEFDLFDINFNNMFIFLEESFCDIIICFLEKIFSLFTRQNSNTDNHQLSPSKTNIPSSTTKEKNDIIHTITPEKTRDIQKKKEKNTWFYITSLHQHGFYLQFSFSTSSGDIFTHTRSLGVVPSVLGDFLKTIGLSVCDVDKAIIFIPPFTRENCYISFKKLFHDIQSHILKVFNWKVITILMGSSKILGNSRVLVNSLSSGMSDFVNEPIKGFSQGPILGITNGIIKGSSSLLKNLIYGVANTVSSVSYGVGGGIAATSFDEEYLQSRARDRSCEEESQSIPEAVVHATGHVSKGLFEGVSGIFAVPIKGLQTDGPVGFIKGLGKGIVGLGVKPLTGLVDAAATISTGIKNQTKTFDYAHNSDIPKRILLFNPTVFRTQFLITLHNQDNTITQVHRDLKYKFGDSCRSLRIIFTRRGFSLLLSFSDSHHTGTPDNMFTYTTWNGQDDHIMLTPFCKFSHYSLESNSHHLKNQPIQYFNWDGVKCTTQLSR